MVCAVIIGGYLTFCAGIHEPAPYSFPPKQVVSPTLPSMEPFQIDTPVGKRWCYPTGSWTVLCDS